MASRGNTAPTSPYLRAARAWRGRFWLHIPGSAVPGPGGRQRGVWPRHRRNVGTQERLSSAPQGATGLELLSGMAQMARSHGGVCAGPGRPPRLLVSRWVTVSGSGPGMGSGGTEDVHVLPALSKSPHRGQEGERPLITVLGSRQVVATCNPHGSYHVCWHVHGTCGGGQNPALPGASAAGRHAVTYRAPVCSPNAWCAAGGSPGTAGPPLPRDPSGSADTRFWEVRKLSPQKLRDSGRSASDPPCPPASLQLLRASRWGVLRPT